MFLLVIGIAAIVFFTIHAFKTAKGTGRNAPGWAAVTAIIGFGIQLVLPFISGVGYGLYLNVTGGSASTPAFGLLTVIEVAALVLSLVGMSLVVKQVSTIPEESASTLDSPPPPPNFNQDT